MSKANVVFHELDSAMIVANSQLMIHSKSEKHSAGYSNQIFWLNLYIG